MGPIALVLFDLDGTLVDSAPDLAEGVNRMLADVGHAPVEVDAVRRWIGNGGRTLVRRALAAAAGGAVDDATAEAGYAAFVDHYAACLDRATTLYPGVREGLADLRARGIRAGCVTNKPGRFTDPLLRALDLADEFAVVVSGDTLPVMKPDAAPLRHAAAACDVEVARCLMVGDTLVDIGAARAAGCRVAWVSYGYSHGQDIAAAAPDAVLHSIAEIATAL